MSRIQLTLILAVLLLPTASLGQTPPGDRYLCYKVGLAKGEAKFSAVQKTLQDQFGTLVADVKGYTSLCNPSLSALRPNVHQVGYKTTLAKTTPAQTKFVKSDHTAYDQFGTHPLTVVKPVELRAPSAKVLGAGGTPTVNTTGVDHFECYMAKPQKGVAKFVATTVPITDQFGTANLTLKKITKLCAPVNKNGEDPSAPLHPGHLVCYQAKLPNGTKFSATTVSVNNTNFRPAVLVAKSIAELCVPAFKDAIPTPTLVPTPTPTPSQTPAPIPTCHPIFNNTCQPPATCQNGQCVTICGGTTCVADEQICCQPSPQTGICCDYATQLCSLTQTSCVDQICPPNETFVPSTASCCQDIALCGTESGGIPADCCNLILERCEGVGIFGACVPR